MSIRQRLVPRSTVSNLPNPAGGAPEPALSVEEGIKARVRDPLWFLARQWQMGEFEASNGGSISHVNVEYGSQRMDRLDMKGASGPVADPRLPVEAVVESGNAKEQIPRRRSARGKRTGWDPSRLQYDFQLQGGGLFRRTTLKAMGFGGERLDWYDFRVRSEHVNGSARKATVFPQEVKFRGLPTARWWEIERERVDLAEMQLSQPNLLALLLMEFGLIYSNDWFVIPLAQEAGTVRKIHRLAVTDTFGRTIEIKPHKTSGNPPDSFHMFALEHDGFMGRSEVSSELLFLPKRMARQSRGPVFEEVAFKRDDASNLVWAIEKRARKRREGPAADPSDFESDNLELVASALVPEGDKASHVPGLRYTVGANLPPSRIPYLAVPLKQRWGFKVLKYLAGLVERYFWKRPPTSTERAFAAVGSMVLRRGRTRSDMDEGFELLPQHRTQVVAESKILDPGAVPSIAISVSEYLAMVAYGTDRWSFRLVEGDAYEATRPAARRFLWIARSKRPGLLPESLGVEFDSIERR